MRTGMVALALALSIAAAASASADSFGQPAQTVLISPCRFLDTRIPGQAGALHDGETRQYSVAGGHCPWDSAAVPIPGAISGEEGTVLGILYTVTVVGATGAGDLVIYDANLSPVPLHSTINFSPGAAVANTSVVAISWNDIKIHADIAGGGKADVVIDILGYLVPAS